MAIAATGRAVEFPGRSTAGWSHPTAAASRPRRSFLQIHLPVSFTCLGRCAGTELPAEDGCIHLRGCRPGELPNGIDKLLRR